jgi:SNF family Na+-dependent transporter
LATFRYAGFFSFIFFLMIFTLGLDSCFGGLEAIYASLADEFAVIKRHRKSSMALIHVMLFLGSLPTVTYGGMYLVTFLDTFSTSPALMLIVFFEAVSVSWFYGLPRFERNIKDMFQIDVSLYFKICWKFVGPAIIFALFFISIVLFQEPVVNNYRFPFAYLVFGWLINISIMLPIPGYVVYKYFALKTGNNSPK